VGIDAWFFPPIHPTRVLPSSRRKKKCSERAKEIQWVRTEAAPPTLEAFMNAVARLGAAHGFSPSLTNGGHGIRCPVFALLDHREAGARTDPARAIIVARWVP
jgi:hypothetical protein